MNALAMRLSLGIAKPASGGGGEAFILLEDDTPVLLEDGTEILLENP